MQISRKYLFPDLAEQWVGS